MNEALLADATAFLHWVESGPDIHRVNRVALIKLYQQFVRVTRLRRPRVKLEELPDHLLTEEVARAALTVKYMNAEHRVLEALSPGRFEFEELTTRSVECTAVYGKFLDGDLPWTDMVSMACAALLERLEASAKELGLTAPPLPSAEALPNVRARVAYCKVLSALNDEYCAGLRAKALSSLPSFVSLE